MRFASLLFVAVPVVASCVLYEKPHGDPGPSTPGTCGDLVDEFERATADLGTCTTDADCVLVGGKAQPSCDCGATLGTCSGTAIARNAPGLPHALNVERDFFASCGGSAQCGAGVDCICDCAPAEGVACSGGRCIAIQGRQCFEPYPDALYPDGGYPDAYIPPDGYVLDAGAAPDA